MEPFDLAHEDWQLATHHFQRGDDAGAEKICREILSELPSHVGATHLLGVICGKTGRLREAIDTLQRASQLEPSSADIVLHLSYAYSQAGGFERALAGFTRVREMNPSNIDAIAMIGSLSLDLGRFSEAAEALMEAGDLRPRSAEVQALKGRALLRVGHAAEAEAPLRRALEIKPGLIEVAVDLGECLAAMGRHEDAEQFYRRWLGKDPRFHGGMIALFRKMGRDDDALAMARESVESGAPSAAAVRMLAGDLARTDAARAIALIQQSLPLIAHDRFGMAGAMFDMARLQHAAGEHGAALETALKARQALAPQGRPAYARGKRYLLTLERLAAFPSTQDAAKWPAGNSSAGAPVAVVGAMGSRSDILADALREFSSLHVTDGGSTVIGLGGEIPGQPLGSAAYPQMIAQMDDAALTEVRSNYLDQIAGESGLLAVDAHAHNVEHLAALARIVPGIRAVVVVRAVRDALAESILEPTIENTSAVVLTSIADMAAGVAGQLRALGKARNLPSLQTLIVDADALAEHPERELKRVCAFLGVAADAGAMGRAIERIKSPVMSRLPKGCAGAYGSEFAPVAPLLDSVEVPGPDAA